MTGAGSGGGGGYDYVEAFYPSDADEGESLYHLTENAAFVYSGTEWIEQTVTDHSQLSGVNEGDHRSDQRVSDLAPVQSVPSTTGGTTSAQTTTKSATPGPIGGTTQAYYFPEPLFSDHLDYSINNNRIWTVTLILGGPYGEMTLTDIDGNGSLSFPPATVEYFKLNDNGNDADLNSISIDLHEWSRLTDHEHPINES